MDWISEKIAIGNYIDGADVEAIAKAGIRSLLCLDSRLSAPEGLNIQRKVVHLEDAPTKQLHSFMKAIETLKGFVAQASPVLVHCHAGRSRSVVVVAGYLMQMNGYTPEEALAFVGKRRQISVTPGVEQLLYYI